MAKWTIEGIGSNSTGSFTIPANTGSTPLTYSVQYDDGNGGGGSTTITVPVCSGLPTNNIVIKYRIATTDKIILALAADFPVTTGVHCSGFFTYKKTTGDNALYAWTIVIPVGQSGASNVFDAPDFGTFVSCCIQSQGVIDDDTYHYNYSPICSENA